MRKKMTLMALTTLFMLPLFAFAQSNISETNGYVLPQTAIKVEVKVATEVIKKGPYAKFAQQYLGVTAPLNDRTTYSIVSSDISSYNEANLSDIYIIDAKSPASSNELFGDDKKVVATTQIDQSSTTLNTIFADMGINPIVTSTYSSITGRESQQEKTLEEMAADVASTIFTLRRRRFDLITGELGENVFGAGLAAAIEEMARLEQEYLALFVGKKSVEYTTYTYDISPEKDKNSYIVARFSVGSGMVAPTDMTGDPLVLTITPENKVKINETANKKLLKSTVKYVIPDMANCVLFLADKSLASIRLGIYQLGVTIDK